MLTLNTKMHEGVDNDQAEEDPFDVSYTHYAVADRTVVCSKNAKTRTPKESSNPDTAIRVDAMYAVVNKSKKKRVKKKPGRDERTLVNKDDLYALPTGKEVKMTDKGGRVVVSGGVEEGELYDDVVELTYKTKTDSIP